ncbi:MAG: thermonuclease family protein [Syntrophus sp. (in: bacteria)]
MLSKLTLADCLTKVPCKWERRTHRPAGKLAVVAVVVAILLAVAWVVITPLARAAAGTVEGTVSKVSDGDTIRLLTTEQTVLKVMLYGIDAPETPKLDYRTGQVNKPGQPYGEEAEQALKSKIYGKQVVVEIMDIDKYKRMVGIIWLCERNINGEMLGDGWPKRTRNI